MTTISPHSFSGAVPPRAEPASDAVLDDPIGPVDDLMDDLLDLTDRRRVLLQLVFGVDVGADVADAVFHAD